MKIKTVIFDLDGTLLDTLEDLYQSVNYALERHGLPLRAKGEVQSFVGNGIKLLMQRASALPDGEKLDEVLSTFKAHYGAHCEDNTCPYEGIIPLLERLKEQGVKTAVVSNKADFATKQLAKSYFGDLLQEAVGENESAGIRKKPAPDSLLAVMERLSAERSSTVYVGDSEVDIQTARNAEVECVSVSWGFKDRAFLKANGATVIVDTPLEILGICKL